MGDRGFYKLLMFFFIGACLLSFLSIFQKILIGAPPFQLKGFIVPVIFGGGSGLMIGLWILKLDRSRKEVLKQRENFRTILNSIGDFVVSCDSDFVITGLNRKAEQMTGIAESNAIGQPFDRFFPFQDHSLASLIQSFEGSEDSDILSIRETMTIDVQQQKHNPIRIEGSISRRMDGTGQQDGFVITFRDITETEKLEAILRQNQKLEAIGSLAGGIAHDFNNILTGIMGFSELMLRGNIDDKQKQNLQRIIDISKSASHLTQNLLTFARKSDSRTEILDINEAIQGSVEILNRTIDKRIVIKTDLAASNARIEGLKGQIDNLIINLAINARDAMPEGGKILIRSENTFISDQDASNSRYKLKSGTYIRIIFSDTGIGIPEANIEKIFDPFFTTKEVGKGTGLGLSSVYGTVLAHRGSIQVSSHENAGTDFIIHLPITSSEQTEVSTPHPSIPRQQGRILVAEDEENIRQMTRLFLQDLGFDVILAVDGEDCIRLYDANQALIDLVILDLIMPKKNGIECLRHINRVNESQKVIVFSGYYDNEIRGQLEHLKYDGFIKKPFTRIDLISKIEAILHGRIIKTEQQ